jgi:hypothetical protein
MSDFETAVLAELAEIKTLITSNAPPKTITGIVTEANLEANPAKITIGADGRTHYLATFSETIKAQMLEAQVQPGSTITVTFTEKRGKEKKDKPGEFWTNKYIESFKAEEVPF